MSDLVVRAAPARPAVLLVERDGVLAGTVELSTARRPVRAEGPLTSDRSREPGAPSRTAWPHASADRAASARWKDPHPGVRIVTSLTLTDATGDPAAVLEAVGEHLMASGIRRLDLRMPASHPLAAVLHGRHWVQGRLGSDLVVSLSIGFPWADATTETRLHHLLASLPAPVRRPLRRAVAIRPRQLPELIRTQATEAGAAIRMRYAPETRSTAVEGAPEGAHPFAASRYRAVRAALDLVPAPLRSSPFIDVGCGDGRVLGEALAAGFPFAYGRELDPGLVERARAIVGDAGRIDEGDALAEPLPDEVQVVFLNNPFSGPPLDRFAELLAESLARTPRPLLLLYLNPRPVEGFLDAGLVLVHVEARFSVLATRDRL